LCEIMEQDTK